MAVPLAQIPQQAITQQHFEARDFISLNKIKTFCNSPGVKKVRYIAIPVILFAAAVSVSSLARNGLIFLFSVIPGLVAGSLKEKSLVIEFHEGGISVDYKQILKKVAAPKEGQEGVENLEAGAEALTLLQKAKKMWNDPRIERIKQIALPVLAIVAAIAVGVSIASFSLGLIAGAATGVLISSMVNRTFQVITDDNGFKIIL